MDATLAGHGHSRGGGTPRLWRSSEVVRRRANRLSSVAALAAVNDTATTFPVE
jgi:hypothetical protein